MQNSFSKSLSFFFLSLFLLHSFFPICQAQQVSSPVKKNWLLEKPQGFYNVTTFNIDPVYGPVLNGMQTICGYKFNPYIAVGGGVGIERFVNIHMYEKLITNLTLSPVFAEIRYTVLKKRITPVFAMKGGYKFLINLPHTQVVNRTEGINPPTSWNEYQDYDDYKQGGFFVAIEGGVKAKVYERLSLYFSAEFSQWSVSGYHYHWVRQYVLMPDGIPTVSVDYYSLRTLAYNQVLLFRLGISF